MSYKETPESQIAGMISIKIQEQDPEKVLKGLADLDFSHILTLPTRNLVLFPGVALPIQLGRESSVKVAEFAKVSGTPIAVVCQLEPETEQPTAELLFPTGTLARVLDVLELPNGVKTAIVEGLVRVKVNGQSLAPTLPDALALEVTPLPDIEGEMPETERQALSKRITELVKQLMSRKPDEEPLSIQLPPVDKMSKLDVLVNNIATHLPLESGEKQNLLAIDAVDMRAMALLSTLITTKDKMDTARGIMEKARQQIEESQREGFLRTQMDVIRQELNEDFDDELDELEEKANQCGMPENVKSRFDKELRKLRRYNPQSPDYAVQFTYLDTLVSLPWADASLETDSLAQAQEILENDHYGLHRVKERILEQLALIMHNPEGQAPIICFVGPPGVGKTSLGQSIAAALGREFQRVSLGGLHDEAEIRGHRRTYIGAMPGRIIEAMRRAKTVNPVIMLDELDKIGSDFKGDPAAALLEVLDPAQNCHFHDNYIDVDYDLSNVIFIATANTLSTISKPLLDRIEIIELSGYTVAEKVQIAKRHILPRINEKHALTPDICTIGDDAIEEIIENYTSESGVRTLEKKLEAISRKKLLEKYRHPRRHTPVVSAGDLTSLLGPAPYIRERYEGNDFPGVVTGLAWTSAGGETLLVEAAVSPGKGELNLTGNLGKVMTESGRLAMEWIKVNADSLGIDTDKLKNSDVHLHFPEGAVPKDGPSAGITITTAITSALLNKKVRPRLAMTGETTLRGKVLPVGGIKEKLLAAKRAGIKEIIMSASNRKDVEDLEKQYLRGLTITYVTTVDEVLARALI